VTFWRKISICRSFWHH